MWGRNKNYWPVAAKKQDFHGNCQPTAKAFVDDICEFEI